MIGNRFSDLVKFKYPRTTAPILKAYFLFGKILSGHLTIMQIFNCHLFLPEGSCLTNIHQNKLFYENTLSMIDIVNIRVNIILHFGENNFLTHIGSTDPAPKMGVVVKMTNEGNRNVD